MQRDAVSLLSVAVLAVVAAASDLSAQTITQLIVTHKTANVARAGTDGPSTVTFTLRQWTSGTSTWPQCTATITFSGSLQTSAPNAFSGQPSFSKHVSWSNTPATHSSGDQYYCDAAKTVFDLKAGSWLLRYQIQNGFGASCGNSLPLSDATSGRINFTSGKTGCNTSFEFP